MRTEAVPIFVYSLLEPVGRHCKAIFIATCSSLFLSLATDWWNQRTENGDPLMPMALGVDWWDCQAIKRFKNI
jgi:hypothetical protein